MEYVYVLVGIVLVIGVLASVYGMFFDPTTGAIIDVFKLNLLINDSITIYNYEVFARNNMTAIDVLSQKADNEYNESGTGLIYVTGILTSSWIRNDNQTEWVFMVNGEVPSKEGVVISPNKFYVVPGTNMSFVYAPKST